MEKLLFILICVSFVVCWRTIMSIGTYFLTKSDALIDDVNRRDLTYPSIKADNTNKFLSIVKNMIENEVMNILKEDIQLNQPYKMLNFDDDSRKIAINVYDSLEKDELSSGHMIITTEYLQKYIIQESIKIFLSAITTHNTTLRDNSF